MSDKLLLEVWMDKGKTDKVRLYRSFIQEVCIADRLKTVCKIKSVGATVTRLKLNGKVKLNKGMYTIYLYNKVDHPEVIQEYRDYRRSQLPTFVEYIQAMKERYCPDLGAVKEIFKSKIEDAYAVEYLARELEKVQVAETQVLMWNKLIGEEWSIVECSLEDYNFDGVGIHSNVIQYLDKLRDDIVMQASFGAVFSTSPSANAFENIKHETIAKWYWECAREIRSLEEGENYR